MNFYKVGWEQLEDDCFKLYQKIKNLHFDRILCVSRGGLVWSRMFSDLLGNLPVSNLSIESYTVFEQQKQTRITEKPQKKFKNEIILAVDEIFDTGKTLKTIIDYLRSLNLKKFYILAPYIKSHTSPLPDFYLKKVDAWVIFPYELQETYTAFLKIYKTAKKAKQILQKYGFDQWKIESL